MEIPGNAAKRVWQVFSFKEEGGEEGRGEGEGEGEGGEEGVGEGEGERRGRSRWQLEAIEKDGRGMERVLVLTHPPLHQ